LDRERLGALGLLIDLALIAAALTLFIVLSDLFQ
jgi:hypothetical protein